MKVEFLSSGLQNPQYQYASTYLINETVAIDAGSAGLYRSPNEQARVRNVFLTHSHADHIGSLAVFVENAYDGRQNGPTIHGNEHTLAVVRQDIFNDRIWPDFVNLPPPINNCPFLRLEELKAEVPLQIDRLQILPVPVEHVVPTLGFIVTDGRSTVIFGADSSPTQRIWDLARDTPAPRTVFIECCFPNSMLSLARISAHLTPQLLAGEIAKMPPAKRIIAVHIKARFRETVISELMALCIDGLEVGLPGTIYEV